MNVPDAIGYLASAAVLATFSMRDMAALRATAIASNVAFIAFGALAAVHPVLLLHLVLLPLNVLRLIEIVRERAAHADPVGLGKDAPRWQPPSMQSNESTGWSASDDARRCAQAPGRRTVD